MDAAAKTVESLSEHILPDKPHHLSYHPHWRYRPRPDDSAPGSRPRFEEWHNTRLQYMTLVSQADRGTLLTRPYYDMREEPPKAVPREVSALAAGGEKKKKLSLTDYKNKKTGTPSSASPPEPAGAKKSSDGDRAVLPPNPDRAATSNPYTVAEPKPNKYTPDSRKLDGSKALDSRPLLDGKPRPPRDGPDTTLPPKPPSLPPKPPSPAARKRVADIEDQLRPQKRSRPDDRRPGDERPPPPPPSSNRDDAQRRKDRHQSSTRDSMPPKEDRLSASSSLPNGRSILKGAVNSARNSSPGARPRGDSINGVRPSLGGNDRGTPTKPDAPKPFVPPLLSPLHLSFDDQNRARGNDEGSMARKKKRNDSGDAAPAAKTKKPETQPLSKKNRPQAVVPPLLSPTLPPAVEAELRRNEKASSEPSDDKGRDGRDALGIKRKPAPDNGDEEPPAKLVQRRRLLLTMDIPKHLRSEVKQILAPPPTRKEATKQDRDKRERDRVGSGDEPQPPARKRPIGSADSAADSLATKKPRPSDASHLSRVAATPSTPSRRSTAMSRVSSGNSMANTPGEGINATPTTSAADRRPNGQGAAAGRQDRHEDIRILNERHDRLRLRAKGLKHVADSIFRPSARPSEDKAKYGFAVALECIITFSMSFQAVNLARRLSNRKGDYASWYSMLPLLDLVHTEMRRDGIDSCKHVFVALLMLHCTCIDEVLRYASNMDGVCPIMYDVVLSMERKRTRFWPWIGELNGTIDDPEMRIELRPWYTIDQVTGGALRVLRNWCADENVDWTPDPMLLEYWPIQRDYA
ncbi:hypothetical protein JDV02_006190 [Purpureocillium takamizusanense]|uniref:Uncharacterized protein n=1 Tax=Purpureocillium takamizusanense TaxID=2060973 RepID=A0A9Q8QFU6_9HYPO|nr:uncharacterized protein JDV02_006190 [Purpureocillium takamizusanense]UNI20064.1 hypothetical protein JDV02_006190 [Purpureocillium takamizusanense]